jgi:hypothetical protein
MIWSIEKGCANYKYKLDKITKKEKISIETYLNDKWQRRFQEKKILLSIEDCVFFHRKKKKKKKKIKKDIRCRFFSRWADENYRTLLFPRKFFKFAFL